MAESGPSTVCRTRGAPNSTQPSTSSAPPCAREPRAKTDTPASPCATPASGEPGDTLLDSTLRELGAATVVIAGLATDYCVRDTALDAVRRGFATFVLIDAVRAVDLHPGDGDRAFEAMRRAGVRSA